MTARDGDLIRRMEDAEKQLRDVRDELNDLNAVKNMGRGVLWFVLKIGTIAATVVGVVWAILAGR